MKLQIDYATLFREELDRIDTLVTIPNTIKEHALSVFDYLLKDETITPYIREKLKNNKKVLENVKDTSIAASYKVVYSQMCILATSSLEAILKKYFENAANYYKNLKVENKKFSEIRISIKDVIDNELKFGGKIGKIILEKEKIGFQDLKSIKNTFDIYFNKKVILDTKIEQQTIFYLEVRHLLVHKGGVVDEKFLSAVSLMNANIKDLKKDDKVELDQNDWNNIKKCFIAVVEAVTIFD